MRHQKKYFKIYRRSCAVKLDEELYADDFRKELVDRSLELAFKEMHQDDGEEWGDYFYRVLERSDYIYAEIAEQAMKGEGLCVGDYYLYETDDTWDLWEMKDFRPN